MEYEPATAPPGAETTPPAAPPGLGDTAQPPTSTPSSNTGATLDVTAPVMTSAAVAVKREPGTGDSGGYNPNQNQAQFDRVKQETVASAHHDIMNQSAAHSSPKLLPSFSFPPFVPPPSSSSSSPPSTSPPLSSLAPSLFSSSTSSTSSLPSSLPPLSHSPAMATPPSAMQSRLSPAPSTPLATSPSSWEQQTLARLNSLTQMTSQIASIALEKTAAKTEAVVEDNPESVVEWVTSISRSLQTELQSVYLTLHSGPAEPSSLPMPPVLVLPAAAPAPVPTSTLTPARLAPSPASPSVSPLSLSPSLPSFMPGQHFLVQAETVPTPVLMGSPTPISSAQPLAASAEESGESKKGRRRRKTKTKDSFNHMQRKCASCQRTETTKWRHGPLGSNTLCNTCGLAYSRKKKREAEQAAKLGAAAAAATGSTPSP